MLAKEMELRAIALEYPATLRVFERHHLDYCCGGRRPLVDACAEMGLAPETILVELESAAAAPTIEEPDFTGASATTLIRHIVDKHHAFVRNELPRLGLLAEKVALRHGPLHPQYILLASQLQQLAEELTTHLFKEEKILFPYIEALEEQAQGGPAAHACFATVQGPIQVMFQEHDAAGSLLEEMRQANNGFTPAEGACPTTTGLLFGLAEFERDLHRHIHLENNQLFPMAVEIEKGVLVA